MSWVKVCGLRTVEDVDVAVEAGADAIGLVLAESPRQIDVDTASRLVEAANGRATTVLVTVDFTSAEAIDALDYSAATGIQPYGRFASEVIDAARERGLFVLEPHAVGGAANDREWIARLARTPGVVPLFDTGVVGFKGGTGRVFDWSLTEGLDAPFVLAGGLDPDNVADALDRTQAWGVDASSGLESNPGTKDHGKIRAFIRGAKTR